MKEARYFYVPQASVQNELPADEAVHALRVLRLAAASRQSHKSNAWTKS